jgi:hypothetical protein
MSFASAIFGGSNPVLSGTMNQTGQTGTFASTKGQGLVSQAGGFMSDIMGGDMSKISKLLSPQIDTMKQQGQQQKKTMAEFGTRSGGTSSAGQTVDDKTRANVNNMISSLTGQAVSGGMQAGQSLIDTGLKAFGQQAEMSQQQLENWSNSIFGQGLAKGAGFLEKAGLSAIPGMG